MSNQTDIESKEGDIPESDFKARRRLLKISAAAPLIVTLSPNAALAQGSLTCAEKNEADGRLQDVDPVVEMFAPDQAVRRLVELYRHSGGGSGTQKPDLYHIGVYFYTATGDNEGTSAPGYKHLADVLVVEYFDVLDDGTSCSLGLFPAVQPGLGTTVLSISCEASIGMISSCSIV